MVGNAKGLAQNVHDPTQGGKWRGANGHVCIII